ncbi:MAG TPA: ABC transporter permease [Longimicrobiales bacterium]|nr:ABC transporter permease [Longimicrobiales bacterium]
MGVLKRWVRRCARLFGAAGGVAERSMEDEMRFHLELEERDLVARGHTPAEARRLARVRFGGVERYKEEGRYARGRVAEDAMQDVRYAMRGVRRRPGFSAAVVATLAVGIGATTAVWSVVDAVILSPLPFPAAERLARIQVWFSGEEGALSPAEYLDYRRGGGEVFSAMGAYVQGSVTVAGGEGSGAERVEAAYVAADLFPALGVAPLVGRPFTAGEELGGERTVVVSEGYWRGRLGGSADAVGRALTLNGEPFTVVGVMPGSFRLPENMVTGAWPAVYVPLRIDPDTTYRRGSHFLQAAARLRDGVPLARAAEAVEGVTARFSADFPNDYEPEMAYRATAVPLREAVVGDVRPAVAVAFGAVLLVLLVGAANVAALLLARGEARKGEIALRATLGARRPRLVRQLVAETLVLGILGGILGVALAWLAIRGLVALGPPGIPRLEEVAIHGRVLAFAGGLSVLCGLLFGLVPAFRVASDGAVVALRQTGARTTGGGRTLRRALVVAEVGLALALLTGAGLLGRSMAELLAVDTGLRLEDVVATQFTVAAPAYPEEARVREFVAAAVDRVSSLPQVEAAGAVTNLPLAAGIGDVGVEVPGKDIPGDGNLDVDWQAATPGYDRAVGLRLLAGRWIDDTDRSDAPGAVVINRAFAETWWPEGDAVGATVRLTAETAPGEARVVGIVEDVKHEGPAAPARLQIYIPHRQFGFWYGQGPARSMTLVARTLPGAATAPGAIRGAFSALDPELGLGPFTTLGGAYREILSGPTLLAALMATFAAIALLLAAIGVYGVIAFGVGQRRREFGIRLALGARSRRVAAGVVREGALLAALGIAVGLAGSLLLSGALRSLLFGVSATDPAVLAGGAAVLMAAALLASWLPARRAVRVDPAEALREE